MISNSSVIVLSTLCLLQLSNGELVRVLRVTESLSDVIGTDGSSTNGHQDQASMQTMQDSIENVNGKASNNSKQISLASLTLQQPLIISRGVRQAADELKLKQQQQLLLNNTKDANNFHEIQLERIKPSWLQVGRQFKITDESINEVTAGSSLPNEDLSPININNNNNNSHYKTLTSSINSEFLLRPAFDSPILLRTKLGIIEGVKSVKFNKYLYTFLSVPYARSPIGELRFKAPEPVQSWLGIYQATKWPPFCVQPSMTLASKSSPVHIMSQIMTEDCLYMNIWTPSLKLARGHRRPVMVWLHGGAFQFGGISVDENDGSALALMGNVVVVSLNYRISAFGFLNANNPLNGPNNVGLLDQQMALKWVQENIKQFGGDPNQVTLFGESAGGHSVGLHMISPKSWPLFKRAILQSGVPTSMLRSYDINPDNTNGPVFGEGAIMVAKRLNCYDNDYENSMNKSTGLSSSSEDDTEEPSSGLDKPILSDSIIDCLRNRSSLEILKAMGAPGNSAFFPTGNDQAGFFPNGLINESFDPNDLKIGPQQDYLIGTNTDEGTFMLHYGLPKIFPAKETPLVDNMDQLREKLMVELESNSRKQKHEMQAMSQRSNNSSLSPLELSLNDKTRTTSVSASREELQSASGDNGGGAQGHLFKPLLRLRSSLVERFMNRANTNKTDKIDNSLSQSDRLSAKRADFGRNIAHLISDIIFLCPSRTMARTLSENKRNVHFYLYGHRSSNSQYHPWIGVTHHDEVEFIFGRPLRMADTYSGDDIDMSQRMIKIWSHFAHTGKVPKQMNNIEWPQYGIDDNNYMLLETRNASVGQRFHDSFCNLYETVISVHLQDN